MRNLWTLGGLSLPELLRRTARESWQDAVFGQGGRMAFYHFLALFPSLLLFFVITAQIPHLGDHMKAVVQQISTQLLPEQAAQAFLRTIDELQERSRLGIQHLLPACAGAAWAALNGTWVLIYGLNNAYEVKEDRSWWQLASTIIGLTVCLAVTASIAVVLIFGTAYLQVKLHKDELLFRGAAWLILIVALSFSFAVLYRFAPNLRDHEWQWSTPGALCALILWIGSTFGARIYFAHVNYARSYGHLNGVVVLLLWLYLTNGAILIGGEMNSEIEKTATAKQR
ncbi:MAG TPA: YihY/virulence factor BrkB family protein [Acidobacteriaceae bacterium]|nr:YihY/virulence factor BrkB family protein [Acidobacteriaceae bacterium]